jgi:hypothetical protein
MGVTSKRVPDGHARRARLDRHGLEAVDGLAAGTATKKVDRAGKLPRRFLPNQSLGAPIERGTTSLFNHWLSAIGRPCPATALVCRVTSKTASQLTNITNGLNGGAFRPVSPKITNARSSPITCHPRCAWSGYPAACQRDKSGGLIQWSFAAASWRAEAPLMQPQASDNAIVPIPREAILLQSCPEPS